MSRPSVNFIIRDSQGRIMLQMRNGPKSNPKPMRWGVFGGRCDGNETAEQALLRELTEELTIVRKIEDFDVLGSFQIPGWDLKLFELKKPLDWNEFKPNEGAGVGFFTLDEIDMLELWDNHEKIIAYYRKVKHD